MINKEYFSFRFLAVGIFTITAVMIFVGLYPLNFFTPNRVQWLSNESGLYFDGAGIAFTEKPLTIALKNGVSIEILLKERRDSKNWGPREIFSFYDGAASPSILLGQQGGRIFIYSRFEKKNTKKWYSTFSTKQRFPREKSHLITVTFNEIEKAIYLDGHLRNKKNVVLNDNSIIEFSGRFLLGNSPRAKNGWRGEIKGLAVYNRILLPEEIMQHTMDVFQKGMDFLAEIPGCLALYPFDEGKGKTAESILGDTRSFHIPNRLFALFLPMLSLPYKDMRSDGFNKTDILQNIVFFIPFGALLSAIILKKCMTDYFVLFLVVIFSGGLLSFVIECLQLFLPTRNPGIADIFCNVLGSVFGIFVALIMLKEKS